MTPRQGNLFGNDQALVEGAENLPLITERNSATHLVFVPGHIYAPTPAFASGLSKTAGPGALEQNEREFISDLVKYLDKDHPQRDFVKERRPAFIQQGSTEYTLLRNIERASSAVKLRIDVEDWFYPDFEFWIRDTAIQPEKQIYCLIDPKGLQQGARGGWANSKVLCLLYKLIEIGQQFPVVHNDRGETVAFIPRGALVSTTPHSVLQATPGDEFRVYDQNGALVLPTVNQFAKAGIFFKETSGYIKQLMTWLTDSAHVVDLVMTAAVEGIMSGDNQMPSSEVACYCKFRFLRNQTADHPMQSTLAELIKWTLLCDTWEQAIQRIQSLARKELVDFIKLKLFTIPEDPRNISEPCKTLLERYLASH